MVRAVRDLNICPDVVLWKGEIHSFPLSNVGLFWNHWIGWGPVLIIHTWSEFVAVCVAFLQKIPKAGYTNVWFQKCCSKPQNSPPARWGLLDFIRVVLLLLLPPPSSSSSSAPPLLPPLPPLPRPLLPCQLLAKLFANFGAQCALLDLNPGPSQLSAHRWTSTWDLPSSVRTAGPQPGTCRA